MSAIDKYSAYTGVVNDSKSRQSAIMMLKNARLTAETQNTFIIQLTSIEARSQTDLFTFTMAKDDLKAFIKGVESDKDVKRHRVFKILKRRYEWIYAGKCRMSNEKEQDLRRRTVQHNDGNYLETHRAWI